MPLRSLRKSIAPESHFITTWLTLQTWFGCRQLPIQLRTAVCNQSRKSMRPA